MYRTNSPPSEEPTHVESPTMRERIKENLDRPSFRVLAIFLTIALLLGLGHGVFAFVPMNCPGRSECPAAIRHSVAVCVGLLVLATPFVTGLFCYMLYDVAGDVLKAIKRRL